MKKKNKVENQAGASVKKSNLSKLEKTMLVFEYIAAFLAPILIVPIVVSFHSQRLITFTWCLVACMALAFCLFFVFLGIFNSRNYGIKYLKGKLVKILVTLVTLACVVFMGILYGPYSGFREWLITTAMSTMSHQYYCQWFYSDAEISAVLGKNYVDEVDEKTNTNLIDTSDGKKEEIKPLSDDGMTEGVVADTKEYRLIRLKVNGMTAYLACVYDPAKVVVGYTAKLGTAGQYVTKMTELKGGVLGVNGAGFYDPGANSAGSTPGGLTISQGKVVTDNSFAGYSGGGLIGFDNKGVLHLMKRPTAQEALNMGIRDAVCWGPFLVVNGKSSYVSGNGGWGLAARTAIGQRADGTVLLLVVDSNSSRSKGASMRDLADIMVNYGAVNAANLDGGTSSVMVMPAADALKVNPDAKTDGYSSKYRIINDPVDSALQHKTRPIADAWVVLP